MELINELSAHLSLKGLTMAKVKNEVIENMLNEEGELNKEILIEEAERREEKILIISMDEIYSYNKNGQGSSYTSVVKYLMDDPEYTLGYGLSIKNMAELEKFKEACYYDFDGGLRNVAYYILINFSLKESKRIFNNYKNGKAICFQNIDEKGFFIFQDDKGKYLVSSIDFSNGEINRKENSIEYREDFED